MSETTEEVNWTRLVQRIQRGDNAGKEELNRIFSPGIRFFLRRQVGSQELDGKVHDTLLIVVQAIQQGYIREPERLIGFVRTVVRRQIAAYSGAGGAGGPRDPEQSLAFREKVGLLKRFLRELPQRDREILIRFYVNEQTEEQICSDMNLSETQFRHLKARAQARSDGNAASEGEEEDNEWARRTVG